MNGLEIQSSTINESFFHLNHLGSFCLLGPLGYYYYFYNFHFLLWWWWFGKMYETLKWIEKKKKKIPPVPNSSLFYFIHLYLYDYIVVPGPIKHCTDAFKLPHIHWHYKQNRTRFHLKVFQWAGHKKTLFSFCCHEIKNYVTITKFRYKICLWQIDFLPIH